MKKNKLLVIFFLSCLLSYIIYNYTINNRINVLVLGDNHLINSKYKTYDKYLLDKYYNINDFNKLFTTDNGTYKDIINNIKNNYFIYEKGKKVYLNQKITESDLIILNANNDNYFEKCSKGKSIIKKYNESVIEDINSLKEIISKISAAKVIVRSNYCYTDNYQLNDGDVNLNNLYFKYQNNRRKRLDDKVNYQIYSEIVKNIG